MTEVRACAHQFLCLLDETNDDATIKRFQAIIFGQDKPILENQVPKRLPLDPRAETPIKADKTSIQYRRWLTDLGVSYGVIRDGNKQVSATKEDVH
jgi:phenylpropionate dioxygenase-like ring-hydroxylating dioxygenase large terminal subunit